MPFDDPPAKAAGPAPANGTDPTLSWRPDGSAPPLPVPPATIRCRRRRLFEQARLYLRSGDRRLCASADAVLQLLVARGVGVEVRA